MLKKISSFLKDDLKSPFPKFVNPMLATLVENVPQKDEWIYEIKWDGYRALALCRGNEVEIRSRNNKLFNDKYYPITTALKKLNMNVVFDGEIVVIKQSGVTSFSSLQNWRSEADGILIYYIFDILWLDGFNLMSLPLLKRKEILKRVIPSNGLLRLSETFETNPIDFLKIAKKLGLEGIIAKRADSLYQPGIRGFDWLKIKALKRHEVVIGGYTINEQSPKLFSSLIVGVYENEELQYIGKIGTGFNQKMQKELMAKFNPLVVKKSPFSTEPDINKPSRFRPNPPQAKAVWLSPKLICEVSYTEITDDGVMRHPSFEGLREDKEAKDVHLETSESIISQPKKFKLHPEDEIERRTLLNPTEETQVKTIKNQKLKFNNLSKVFWPQENYSKRDLINYYYQAAEFILPYLKNRPQSLNRFPNGIEGESFYQKDVSFMAPEWIKKFPYRTSDGKNKNYLIVQNEADLLWMANLGAIEMNPWNSTVDKPDYPTWCSIDIDPSEENNFIQVIETALETKKLLDQLKISSFCKTSGASGLHIYIPLNSKYTYEQCQLFGRMIATEVHLALPSFTSVERYTTKRKGKVYVDFLQNRPKATLAAPYSVRPREGATVSMPLHWDEVNKKLHPKQFTMANAIQRMRKEGDLFSPVLKKGIDIKKAILLLDKIHAKKN